MRVWRIGATTVVAVVAIAGNVAGQSVRSGSALEVVARLYRDFAWEAVVETPNWQGHELLDQPRAVLARYFDNELIRLWLADRACEARTHEICKIDFMPIWDSQDPSGSFVSIDSTADPTLVKVQLRHPFKTEPRVLNYRLVKTPDGWRIHDIVRPGNWSLVSLLSAKR
ncbi:MAG TPA: hypothetical protein VGP95_05235 [Gemmatimonadaceae bacterium]|nr:hypothetical protein [Gemmatimonadaceae bacterium]